MRILCLLPKSPLPADHGSLLRLLHLLRALESVGSIDLVVAAPLTSERREALTEAFPQSRVMNLDTPIARKPFALLGWLRARSLPIALARMDTKVARDQLRKFIDASPEPYDLVWSFSLSTTWIFEPIVGELPRIDDMADVTWVQADRRLAVARESSDRHRIRRTIQRFRLRGSRERWKRFERNQAKRATLITVCSDADRNVLGLPGAVVVPNGYDRPKAPCGHDQVRKPPVLVMAGLMYYEPNADGAMWFTNHIFPIIRRTIPDVQLLVVGRASDEVLALGQVEGVEVTGFVPNIEDALSRADAIVVPLRQGSGTRIKIIEAWAHHLPIVATTIGAEGLGMVDGRDGLLADSPEAFADAVVRVLTDSSLRKQVVKGGTFRFDSTFDWEPVEHQFADLVTTTVKNLYAH